MSSEVLLTHPSPVPSSSLLILYATGAGTAKHLANRLSWSFKFTNYVPSVKCLDEIDVVCTEG